MNQAVVLEKECVFFLRSGCVCLPGFSFFLPLCIHPITPRHFFLLIFGEGGGEGRGRGRGN